MKDGDFDRVRIPMGNRSGRVAVGDTDAADDDGATEVQFQQRAGVAAYPGQLAAGSAILAGLILVGFAAMRRRRSTGPDTDEAR